VTSAQRFGNVAILLRRAALACADPSRRPAVPDQDPRPPWADQPTHAYGAWPGPADQVGQASQPGGGYAPYGPPPAQAQAPSQAPVEVRV